MRSNSALSSAQPPSLQTTASDSGTKLLSVGMSVPPCVESDIAAMFSLSEMPAHACFIVYTTASHSFSAS